MCLCHVFQEEEEVYVAPPGDKKLGLRWATELPEVVLVEVRTTR